MATQVRIEEKSLENLLNEMPASSLELSLRSKRRLGKIMGVHGPNETEGRLITDGLVRLVDKATLEYAETRSRLVSFCETGYLDNYHRAQDHFESFIQALHRAVLYLDRLRAMGYVHKDGTPLVPRARELDVLKDQNKKMIRTFRDKLEHLDKDILNGKVDSGDDVGPQLKTASASIGDCQIWYQDALTWLTQIHAIAAELSIVRIVVGDATTSDA